MTANATNEIDVWTEEGSVVISMAPTGEFDVWTYEGTVVLDIGDTSGEERRRVQIF